MQSLSSRPEDIFNPASRYFTTFSQCAWNFCLQPFKTNSCFCQLVSGACQFSQKSLLGFVHNANAKIYEKQKQQKKKNGRENFSLERNVVVMSTGHLSRSSTAISCFSSFFSAFTHYHFACDLRDTASIWEPTQRAAGPAPWPGHSAPSTHFSEDKWRRGDNNASSS